MSRCSPRGATSLAFLLAALVGAPSLARADESPAEALLQRGVALRRERRDAEALAVFREAYAKAPSAKALGQIGLAEQALALWLPAEDDLARALADAGDAWIVEHAEGLRSALAKVRAHLARLEVESNVDGAEVWIDGQRVAKLPLSQPLRVLAGHVALEVRAPGYAPMQRDLDVPADSFQREVTYLHATSPIAPVTEDRPPTVIPPAREAARPNVRTLAWASLAVGGTLVAGGVVGTLVAGNRNSRFDAQCPNGARDPECAGLKADAASAQSVAVAGYAVGGAALATSTLLFVLPPSSRIPPRHLVTGGFVAGGAFLAAGVGAWIYRQAEASKYNDHCAKGVYSIDPGCGGWKADVAAGDALAITAFSLGGAALIGTGILAFTSPRGDDRPQSAFECSVGWGDSQLACHGTF
jgi:hypothetical protein